MVSPSEGLATRFLREGEVEGVGHTDHVGPTIFIFFSLTDMWALYILFISLVFHFAPLFFFRNKVPRRRHIDGTWYEDLVKEAT